MRKDSLRTCINCAVIDLQEQMIRLVYNNGGYILVNAPRRVEGRGAYVCTQECLNQALQKNKIARALRLRKKVTPEMLKNNPKM